MTRRKRKWEHSSSIGTRVFPVRLASSLKDKRSFFYDKVSLCFAYDVTVAT